MEKLPNGMIRVYTDHTGRWYQDYTQAEYDDMCNDPLLLIFKEEIQKEIDREILDMLENAKCDPTNGNADS